MKRSVFACVVVLATGVCFAAEVNVPLTATERNGVARVNEPIVCGVPFAKGALKEADLASLQVLGPDGKAVPAAFTVASRWYPDPSVKWLHVDFQPSVAAKEKAVYTLKSGAAAAVADPLTATEKDGVVTVVTGPLKFTVKAKGFNLLDEVWVDESGKQQFDAAHQIVNRHTGGITLLSSHMGLPKNKVYTAANDPNTKVAIEESNALHAVVKVTGQHVSTDDLAGPKVLLDYVLRIYAHRGSPSLRIVYTVMHRTDTRIHAPIPVDGMSIRLPLSETSGKWAYSFGKPDGGTVSANSTDRRAWVEVTGSDRYAFGGDASAAGEGKCKAAMPTNLGWATLCFGPKTLSVGIQRFWQLWPKALEVTADGFVVAHLWPNLDGKVLPLPKQDEKTEDWNKYTAPDADYPIEKALRSRLVPGRAHFFLGMSKTHELMFTFQSKPDEAAVKRAWYAVERPLRAVCPTSYYCQETRAFGKVADSSAALYKPEVAKEVQGYDARLKDWLNWIAVEFRAKEYGKDFGVYDQYGMFDFGCSINFERSKGNDNKPEAAKPVSFHWDNNYYDFPHACILQWARTGDQDFLETAREADQHCIDVDTVAAHPDKSFIGAPRYCPGRMHICQDGTSIYVSDTYNHFKNLCSFDMWYLLREHHFRDRGYMKAGFVLSRGRSGLSQARSVGHGIRGALEAYRCGGDEKYLRAALNLVDYKFTRTGSGSWQDGIALEGFRELFEQTGDEKLAQTVVNGVNASMEKKDYAPAILHAYGFAAARTGDEKYRTVVLERLPRVGNPRKMWGSVMDFGNTLRNAPFMFWYVSNLPQKE